MSKKHSIDVHKKGEGAGYVTGQPGDYIETIKRVLYAEQCGNFNPLFCTYKGKKELVRSRQGDLSDPFRRTEEYANELYLAIED